MSCDVKYSKTEASMCLCYSWAALVSEALIVCNAGNVWWGCIYYMVGVGLISIRPQKFNCTNAARSLSGIMHFYSRLQAS